MRLRDTPLFRSFLQLFIEQILIQRFREDRILIYRFVKDRATLLQRGESVCIPNFGSDVRVEWGEANVWNLAKLQDPLEVDDFGGV